ncbi:hypothetical protein ISF_03930 [Cordyceps fumosorosea ARSEF 2679]|uniref:ER-bound oxygenase mpaB/mpaB'/Rubber oxygenase catalytic domain-containing protein n=1 Tax=Cordyceps fumosorosea (strain ARSEF 2679) TaxID=1081104 RepID=A0A162JAH9_CORFA|nr:hypothetical protein ISF_03930 [Cordyceps fumosorosea ARSEF 2679]OAA66092.1 hypothetical protein ISF_03930 [Cordyceps fumosorosea ARSEF 2679]
MTAVDTALRARTTAVTAATPVAETTKYKKPHIYETIEEPTLLRELLLDDIYVLGGQFAILCQWAHPGLAIGTYKRSNFASRVANRLKTTLRFMNAAVYGTREQQEAIFSVVHRYHAPVRGENYDANDPELHKWTAATLFVAFVVIHDLVFGPLPRAAQERLFKQSAVYGTSLRMPAEMWPETLDDFWAYWDHNIATLKVTDEARSLARDLLWPVNLPLGLTALSPLARLVTANVLPERLAREYELEPSAASRALFGTVAYGMATVYPMLPLSIRQSKHAGSMGDLERAVQRIKETGHWVGTPTA